MTRPLTPSKLLLIADRRDTIARPTPGVVRRFRLARLKLEAGSTAPVARLSDSSRP